MVSNYISLNSTYVHYHQNYFPTLQVFIITKCLLFHYSNYQSFLVLGSFILIKITEEDSNDLMFIGLYLLIFIALEIKTEKLENINSI